jgi:hypothetical protein
VRKHRKVTWVNSGWMPFLIGYVPDEDAFAAVSWKFKLEQRWPGDLGGSAGWCQDFKNLKTGEGIILIAIFGEGRDPSDITAMIVHESVHAWQKLCQMIGEEAPGMEMEAYGIQKIFEGIRCAYEKEWGRLT